MTVYLVGAGPGDPGLITARGLELVRACDALVYDRLVAPSSSPRRRLGALRIARDPLAQAEIDELLVRLGRAGLDGRPAEGRRSVRLRTRRRGGARARGGRCPVRGRARRLVACRGAGRGRDPGHASRRLVAGDDRLRPRPGRPRLRMPRSSTGDARRLHGPRLARRHRGRPARGRASRRTPRRPSCRGGTTPEQRVVAAPLAAIAEAAGSLDPPALVVVGDVVALAGRLAAHELLGAAAA